MESKAKMVPRGKVSMDGCKVALTWDVKHRWMDEKCAHTTGMESVDGWMQGCNETRLTPGSGMESKGWMDEKANL
jgi:hypothetical protein